MSKISLVFIFMMIILKLSLAQAPFRQDYWVVWNIGQGQWVTHVLTDECIHYDIGGEIGSIKAIKNKLLQSCGAKRNLITLSHWDLDHYVNLNAFTKIATDICWLDRPAITKLNKSILTTSELAIPQCKNVDHKIQRWKLGKGNSTNDLSTVSYENGWLLPGDSTIKNEKNWSKEMSAIDKTKFLVLGHHGSRTSTSDILLKRLPNLKLVIASARQRKYGHPHKETLLRLQKNKTPVLKTEDWGSIWFL